MAEPKAPTKQAAVTEVELLQPVEHDGQIFSRGIHTLAAEISSLFLSFRDPISRDPIARTPEVVAAPKGTTAPAPKA